jgi:hypothetical protein
VKCRGKTVGRIFLLVSAIALLINIVQLIVHNELSNIVQGRKEFVEFQHEDGTEFYLQNRNHLKGRITFITGIIEGGVAG